MACLRLTLTQPRPGNFDKLQSGLAMLDEKLAKMPALIFSFVTEIEASSSGSIALRIRRKRRIAWRCKTMSLPCRRGFEHLG